MTCSCSCAPTSCRPPSLAVPPTPAPAGGQGELGCRVHCHHPLCRRMRRSGNKPGHAPCPIPTPSPTDPLGGAPSTVIKTQIHQKARFWLTSGVAAPCGRAFRAKDLCAFRAKMANGRLPTVLGALSAESSGNIIWRLGLSWTPWTTVEGSGFRSGARFLTFLHFWPSVAMTIHGHF